MKEKFPVQQQSCKLETPPWGGGQAGAQRAWGPQPGKALKPLLTSVPTQSFL